MEPEPGVVDQTHSAGFAARQVRPRRMPVVSWRTPSRRPSFDPAILGVDRIVFVVHPAHARAGCKLSAVALLLPPKFRGPGKRGARVDQQIQDLSLQRMHHRCATRRPARVWGNKTTGCGTPGAMTVGAIWATCHLRNDGNVTDGGGLLGVTVHCACHTVAMPGHAIGLRSSAEPPRIPVWGGSLLW